MVGVRYTRYRKLPKAAALAGQPKRVKIGFPAGKADGGIIDRAIYNEFGTKGSGVPFVRNGIGGFGGPIPERPFMRQAFRSNKAKYGKAMKFAAPSILNGTVSMLTVLTQLGQLGALDVQDSITSLRSPPNSELTILIKGSSNPLIDTGEMRQSVTYKVDK